MTLGVTDESAYQNGRKRKVTDETTETLFPLLLGIDKALFIGKK
jgi:hypothetical protein